MAQLQGSISKPEFNDGANWFTIASENWVLNTLNEVPACFAATTGNLTATYANGTNGVGATLTNSGSQAPFSVDNVTMAGGSRVLVKNQSTASQNGVYIVTTLGSVSSNWVLTRDVAFDSAVQMKRGMVFEVIEGTVASTSLWMLTSVITTVGSDAINISRVSQSSITNIVGTANQITATMTSGVVTLSIATNPVFSGNGSITVPVGTTAQRPGTTTAGMIRLNTSL